MSIYWSIFRVNLNQGSEQFILQRLDYYLEHTHILQVIINRFSFTGDMIKRQIVKKNDVQSLRLFSNVKKKYQYFTPICVDLFLQPIFR